MRACLLDVLVRLQPTETLKPHSETILKLLMNLLRNENEENGVACMKILTSLHRAYKTHLFDQVQPFLDLVMDIYKNIPKVVKDLFDTPATNANTPPLAFQSPKPVSPNTGSDFGESSSAKPLQKAMFSFKVLTECPIIIVLLYSTHKQIVGTSLPQFIPLIIQMLSLQAAPQAKAHEQAAAKREICTTISPQIKNRTAYGEFIVAQVKTMSFLAYALRGFQKNLQQQHQQIPDFVVRLLCDCPCELSAARKELLVATRHILSTEFRKHFIPKVDILLNENVLIGNGLTVHETLRPLAYSTMADLVHHVRQELKAEQIWKTVRVYCKNMQDNTLATSFQIMSAKLLLNLVERIMKLPGKDEGRQIMVLILNAFVERFSSLNRSYSHIMKREKQKSSKEKGGDGEKLVEEKEEEEDNNNKMDEDKEENEEVNADLDPFDVLEDTTIQVHTEPANGELKDARYIFKNLMNFLKTVMFGLKSCNPLAPSPDFTPAQWQESARMFNYEQIAIFRQLFREGITGHLFFSNEQGSVDDSKQSFDLNSPGLMIPSSKDEKDLMEAFATVFIHIDPASFNEILSAELPFLYESMFKNNALLHIPQFFLASEATSSNFSGILMAFLKTKLPELGEGDHVKSNILIRLFKLCFMAVTLFPNANESVILPHLRELIVGCMELTTTAKEPLVYFNLLRTLFRSIGGGRFEMLYNEVLPLLQVLLESLNRLLATARRQAERNIYVELCLTVPVRLNVLVPHLSYLMRPLVLALNGTQELVSQGLRTLELCVDNLTAEYFDPIIEPVIGEVMSALWKHLRPLPYAHQHSHTTLRVLGKLGGRNRRFLKAPDNLKSLDTLNQEISMMWSFNGVYDKKPIKITPGIESALQVLEDGRYPNHYKVEAFKFLSTTLKLFLDSEDSPDLGSQIRKCIDALSKQDWYDVDHLPESKASPTKTRLENELVEKLLQSVFISASIECDQVEPFLKNICEHFTVLELGKYALERRRNYRKFEIDDHEGPTYCDPLVLLDAITFALCHYNDQVRQAGFDAIDYIYYAGRAMLGPEIEARKLPMFRMLYNRLSHQCFANEFYQKAGAIAGLEHIREKLDVQLLSLCGRQSEFVRTLLFVIKDVPNDVPSEVRDKAKQLILSTLQEFDLENDNQIAGLLTYELANSNSAVRDCVKQGLELIANRLEKPVAELMDPVKTNLLTPIFGKPLRALPFPMQIGHIDAITWCLGLKNTFIEANEEFTRLLHEALALVDAEDESLTSVHRAFEHRTSEQLTKLRIVCINLLTLALQIDNNQQARPKIIAVFLKTLYSKSEKVVDAAHSGLSQVLQQNVKLPRDLLQNGLRPILMNLSDHKRLTVAGLEGLARLLELLTSYFKVEIGKKLLDHLKAWAEESHLHQISSKNLDNVNSVKVMVGILNTFHLLPNTAHMFMNDIMQILLKIEQHLRRSQDSPFRVPVAKFLNRYPKETFEYFMPKLGDRIYGRFFASILESDLCDKLRQYTRDNVQQLKDSIDGDPEQKCISICNMIYVLKSLTKDDESWIISQKGFLDDLNSSSADMIQTSSKSTPTSPLYLQVEQSLEELQHLYIMFFNNHHQSDIDLFFSIIHVLCTNNIKVSGQFHDYIFNNVVSSKDVGLRKSYLLKCIELNTRTLSMASRTFMFRYIVNPILMVEGNRSGDLTQLLEKATGTAKGQTWLDLVHTKIWRNASGDVLDEGTGTIDHYRFELLRMSALLIKLGPSLVADARKDIIKFGWNFIKLEDIISKQSAFVLIAYFINTYDTLSKIVVQIYIALLKAHQSEARSLVRQALDLIAPVLPKRLQSPLWAKWPRRVLSEDGHNVAQVVHIYQFISRHAELFFEYRDHFVPTIIAVLPKLTYANNQQTDNQILAVDLAELMLKWERMAKDKKQKEEEEKEAKEAKDGDKAMESIQQTYSIPFNQREACITYLIRFICVSPGKATENHLSKRVIDILNELLSDEYWTDVNVKLSFFERSLITNDLTQQNSLPLALNALEVISITMGRKSFSFVVENIQHLERLLEKSVKSDNVGTYSERKEKELTIFLEIHTELEKVLDVVLKALKEETDEEDIPEPTQSFLKMLNDAVVEHLGSNNNFAGITLAGALLRYKDSALDTLFPGILKSLGRLVKEHNAEESTNATTQETEVATKRNTQLIMKVLDYCSTRISYLGDQRRAFLTLVAQLIDRSKDKQVCNKIVDLTRNWVFSKTDLFPTMKEKAAILTKMLGFESRVDTLGADLLKKYYNVVVDIYTDGDLARSDLSQRMEHPFLIGTRLEQVETRQKLMKVLGNSIDRSLAKRLTYVIQQQNWEYLAEYQWLNQGLQLLYGGVDQQSGIELRNEDYQFAPLNQVAEALKSSSNSTTTTDEPMEVEDNVSTFVERRLNFLNDLRVSTSDIIEPLIELQYQVPELVHSMWVQMYTIARAALPHRERIEMSRSMLNLLTKEYHIRQIDMRPNVVQSLVEGIGSTGEHFAPHLVKYCGKQFNAWYQAIQVMENIEANPVGDSQKVTESNLDALVEMYASLQENDMFYGGWRRRAKYTETNSGLSYEQCGMWNRAMQMYEAAQIKARSGALPYSDAEYAVWEDHWVTCAQKMQQWDILTELAKHEGFTDLLLECGWRVADWTADKDPLEQSIKTVMDVPTPRRQIFETFLCLQSYAQKGSTVQDLSKFCDEGIQLSLRKWFGLPNNAITGAHIPLLHTFQQYVEFMEASQVYTSLQSTTAQNLDQKSQELKGVLQAWRERLPNLWDDINIWGDLVTWRQHAFTVINKTYIPLLSQLPNNGNNNSNSYAYRGYHEIAWIINRFAHVARKHNMPEVCISQLARIYTLPNIEIQEAFLKLREQAKCHYQNPNEMNTGLDVISNTNLYYFVSSQKAEFFTLKGMFFAKLGQFDEANNAFSTAVQIDLYLPKAWAEWGYYNDRRFKENPEELVYASNAISCYLQAAGLYKNGKTRKLLGRILWLISMDDPNGAIQEAFDNFRGDIPVWYWITFIPQLLTSLAHKEAGIARQLLIKIAKSYPQALHFHLRTTKEDYSVVQRQAQQAAANAARGAAVNQQGGGSNSNNNSAGSPAAANAGTPGTPGVANAAAAAAASAGTPGGASNSTPTMQAAQAQQGNSNASTNNPNNRQPWEYVDEIMGILKTAYPLLALSLETIVDQIYSRFKCPVDEDAYRLIQALLNDGLQYMGRMSVPKEDAKLPPATEHNITRFAESVLPKHIKTAFEADFVVEKPNLENYILKLRKWRDRFEEKLDARDNKLTLESISPHLSEFHYQKFEDIEVPGQYFEHKDNNVHFVKIERFLSNVEVVRGVGICNRRLTILGHDGSLHPFAVQYPAARHCRREERVTQLFKILNGVISRRKEARSRNLQFTLPVAVPLTPHIRIVQDDSRYVSMNAIYEEYCRSKKQSRDAPLDFASSKLRAAFDPKLPKPDIPAVKMEILNAIQSSLVPSTILRDYFTKSYKTFADFWLFRKQFSYQYAAVTFMTFLMSINNRYPHKILINAGSGNIWSTEMLPVLPAGKSTPQFHNGEPVPFRLTPNIQTLMGPTALEGLYSMSVMIIARGLTEPEFDLDQYLCIFVRDELVSWYTQQRRPSVQDQQLREIVRGNVEAIVKRASSLSQHGSGNIPANQTVIDLVSQAVNPRQLALTDPLWMPYL